MEALAAVLCGFFSGLGIGGGSLLMVWMTAVLAIRQADAQGINLLFYLPTAGLALLLHAKNRLIDWKSAVPALVSGCVFAALGALLSGSLDTAFLRQLLGVLLLAVGIRELFARN